MELNEIELPADLGICRRRSQAASPETVLLIATGAGHSANSEMAVVAALKHLHGIKPIEWIFETLDGAQKSGHMYVDQRELDLVPYRNFPDKEITAGIADSFVKDGRVSAAFGFGLKCEPALRVQPLDDWYAWAQHREALRRLNREAGGIEGLFAALRVLFAEESREGKLLLRLERLVKLAWAGSEWSAGKDQLQEFDSLLARLRDPGLAIPDAAAFLSRGRDRAAQFYAANFNRTRGLIRKSMERMRSAGGSTAAIVVAIPWLDWAGELLRESGVAHLEIVPVNVAMEPMLDRTSELLAEVAGDSKLLDLFSGREVRTRVRVMMDEERKLTRYWSSDWAQAAQGLSFEYDYARAEECVRRALELDSANAQAWWIKGGILFETGQPGTAVDAFQRAVDLKPRNASYWLGLATALDGAGRKRQARKGFVRGLRLDPREGDLWCRFGIHLHGLGRRRAACYCFAKGEACGNDAAAQNRRTVCRSRASILDCPFGVLPIVLSWCNRLHRIARQLAPDPDE